MQLLLSGEFEALFILIAMNFHLVSSPFSASGNSGLIDVQRQESLEKLPCGMSFLCVFQFLHFSSFTPFLKTRPHEEIPRVPHVSDARNRKI